MVTASSIVARHSHGNYQKIFLAQTSFDTTDHIHSFICKNPSMLTSWSGFKLLLFVACLPYATALTSLYIPGFDPQPVTADELGVGSDGQTTWLIAPGVSSGTLDDSGFYGPATLVLGPSTAELNYIDPSAGISLLENCDVAGSLAECSAVAAILGADGTTMTQITQETVNPFPVQVGTATINAGSPMTTPPPTQSPSPSAGSSVNPSVNTGFSSARPSSAGPNEPSSSPSSGSPSQASPKSTTNGAANSKAFSLVSVAFVGVMAFGFLV